MTSVDEFHYRLKRAGWSVGDIAFETAAGWTWQVIGFHGQHRVVGEAPTQNEAWEKAINQADCPSVPSAIG